MRGWARKNLWPAVFSIFIFGPILWWTMDRTPPFEVLYAEPIPNPAQPADPVDFQWHIKVIRNDCTAIFQRNTEDSDGRTRSYLPTVSSWTNAPIGAHVMATTAKFIVPLGTLDGDMKVNLAVTAVCNPVHHLWPIKFTSPPAIIHVSRGGPRGEKGDKGDKGDRGERGYPGLDAK